MALNDLPYPNLIKFSSSTAPIRHLISAPNGESITIFILYICILYIQQDATCTTFFTIISALHVSGGSSAHHQELIKLYVQPWVL
jgi:hypothetical protein